MKEITYECLDTHFKHLYKHHVINVIPLFPGTKKPMVKWEAYQKKRFPENRIMKHKGNFGIICGDPLEFKTGYLTILDIDDKKGEEGLYKYFKNIPTLKVKTPSKGFHIYFSSGKQVSNKNNLAKTFGLDFEIRGRETEYCVLPPSSISGSGHILLEKGDKNSNNYPIIRVKNAEEYIKNILIAEGLEPKIETEKISTDYIPPVITHGEWIRSLTEEEIKGIVRLIEPIYKEGRRQNIALALSGWLYKAEINFESAKEIINRLSKNDGKEIKQRFEALNRTYFGDKATNELVGSSAIFKELKSYYEKSGSDNDKAIKYHYDNLTKLIVSPLSKLYMFNRIKVLDSKVKNIILREIVNFLNSRYSIVIDELTSELYIYNVEKGYYEPYNNKQFLKFISDLFAGHIFFEEETKKIKSGFSDIKRESIEYIAFKNCLLNTRTLETSEFTPDEFVTFQVPYNWNPKANSEFMENSLKSILEDETDEDKLTFFLQWLGYCFKKGNPHHKLLFITGKGGNGKSTLLDLILAIFHESVSSVPLHEFSKTFGLEPLLKKRINTLYDIPKKYIKDTGFIKAVTGQDTMNINRKHKSSVNTKLDLKIIGVGNVLPPVEDESDAFWRRVFHIELNNQFTGDNKDVNLAEKLINDNEALEWLIYQSITAYKRIEEGNKWAIDTEKSIVRSKYLKIADPCLYAAEKLFEKTNDEYDFYTRDEIIKVLSDSLRKEKLIVPRGNLQFHNAIRNIGGNDAQRRVNGEPTRGFTLISMKKDIYDVRKERFDNYTVIKLNKNIDGEIVNKSGDVMILNEFSNDECDVIEVLHRLKDFYLTDILREMKEEYEMEKNEVMNILKYLKREGYIILDNESVVTSM
ncbi:MAG: phage/plasmid primase, P4 family [Methanobacterium sp.]